jgi:hypothetical protein|tara:strand:+ start:414 stop:824 length:411 start_codon:yes stop_codon:yes gene_type:complete
MKFNIRVLKENDYEDILVGWWKDWKWIPPVKDFLPLNGLGGIMVEWNDIPVCAGFIIQTNSKVAWIEWIVSNKNFKEKLHRKDALNLLVQTLTDVAKKTGSTYAYTILKSPSLINTYKNNGYLGEEQNINEMIKKL